MAVFETADDTQMSCIIGVVGGRRRRRRRRRREKKREENSKPFKRKTVKTPKTKTLPQVVFRMALIAFTFSDVYR